MRESLLRPQSYNIFLVYQIYIVEKSGDRPIKPVAARRRNIKHLDGRYHDPSGMDSGNAHLISQSPHNGRYLVDVESYHLGQRHLYLSRGFVLHIVAIVAGGPIVHQPLQQWHEAVRRLPVLDGIDIFFQHLKIAVVAHRSPPSLSIWSKK